MQFIILFSISFWGEIWHIFMRIITFISALLMRMFFLHYSNAKHIMKIMSRCINHLMVLFKQNISLFWYKNDIICQFLSFDFGIFSSFPSARESVIYEYLSVASQDTEDNQDVGAQNLFSNTSHQSEWCGERRSAVRLMSQTQ